MLHSISILQSFGRRYNYFFFTKIIFCLTNSSIGRSPYQSKPIDVFAFLGQFESAEWFFEQQRQLERQQHSDRGEGGREQSRDYEYYDLPAFTTPAYTTPTTPTMTTTTTTTTTTRKVKPNTKFWETSCDVAFFGCKCRFHEIICQADLMPSRFSWCTSFLFKRKSFKWRRVIGCFDNYFRIVQNQIETLKVTSLWTVISGYLKNLEKLTTFFFFLSAVKMRQFISFHLSKSGDRDSWKITAPVVEVNSLTDRTATHSLTVGTEKVICRFCKTWYSFYKVSFVELYKLVFLQVIK